MLIPNFKAEDLQCTTYILVLIGTFYWIVKCPDQDILVLICPKLGKFWYKYFILQWDIFTNKMSVLLINFLIWIFQYKNITSSANQYFAEDLLYFVLNNSFFRLFLSVYQQIVGEYIMGDSEFGPDLFLVLLAVLV